jgi:hypothetical protein
MTRPGLRSTSSRASSGCDGHFGDFAVADYGWHNDDVFVVAVRTPDGRPLFDAPAMLIDKATGKLTEIHGLLGADPAPHLVPIGDAPE